MSRYAPHLSKDEIADLRARVLEVLDRNRRPLTTAQISFKIGPFGYSRRTLPIHLRNMVEDGLLELKAVPSLNPMRNSLRLREKAYTLPAPSEDLAR